MPADRPDFRRAVAAGAAATLALAVLMYAAPYAGFPPIDMASAIGGFLSHPALLFSTRWWFGLAVFCIFGIVVSPIAYAVAAPNLFGNGWQRGMQWGVLVWVFGAVAVMYHLGLAFHEPFTASPNMTAMASLIGNLLYGVVLGALAGGVRKHVQAATA